MKEYVKNQKVIWLNDKLKIQSLDKRGKFVNTVEEYQKEVVSIYYHAQMHGAILGLRMFTDITSDEISDMVQGILWEIDRLKEIEAAKEEWLIGIVLVVENIRSLSLRIQLLEILIVILVVLC